MAETDAEPEDSKPRSKFNPEIKLPSFGRKKAKVAAATATRRKAWAEASEAEPQQGAEGLRIVTLPANLQGPLNEVERKIALGSMVAVVAAAALGYMSAPSEETTASAPTPAPTATSR